MGVADLYSKRLAGYFGRSFEMKRWMVVTVETQIEWPAEETTIEFMGRLLVLRPPAGDSAADLRLQYEYPEGEQKAVETICRFLSTLSWHHRRPARGRYRISCTAPMRGGSRGFGPPLCKEFELSPDLKTPPDPKARVALALYREALSVDNTPYEFLGYFKVINICYHTGKDQKDWINRTLPLLTDKRARQRIAELTASERDIGAYLYASGRCAVAHASLGSCVVDPDNPEDVLRLSADMPVARALAEYLIEIELGVPWEFSKST